MESKLLIRCGLGWYLYMDLYVYLYIYTYNISLYKRLYEIHDTILCLFSFYVIGLPDHIICIIHD